MCRHGAGARTRSPKVIDGKLDQFSKGIVLGQLPFYFPNQKISCG
jgi:hypothetical protein